MATEKTASRPTGDQGGVVTPEYVGSVAPATQRQARGETFDAEVIQSAEKFDARFGSNALQHASVIPEEALNEYSLISRLNDGVETTYTIHSPDLEDATQQAWREIQKRENVAAAKLEWDGGNEVSYIYDRKQGIELDRPAGLVLPHERQQQREQLKERQPPAQKQGYSRDDLVRQLRDFSKKKAEEQKQRGYKYVSAEAAISTNLANQIEAGVKTIDLSQHYATDDPAKAQERHQKALENLAPVLREAEKQGQALSYGQGIAHGKGEVLALQDLKRGLSNTQGLLQKAGQHHGHHAQAPRLSMSSDGGF